MHVGGRVNALDWDNVGTIIHLHDHDGTATIDFTSAPGTPPTKTLPWHQLQPIDQPRTRHRPRTVDTYVNSSARPNSTNSDTIWNDALADHGIGPDDHASSRRPSNTANSNSPTSSEPTHPTGSPTSTAHAPPTPPPPPSGTTNSPNSPPGATPTTSPPTSPATDPHQPTPLTSSQWRDHQDRSLTTHHWLRTPPTPTRTDSRSTPLDTASIRRRLDELDSSSRLRPPTSARIIHDLTRHHDITTKLDELTKAIATNTPDATGSSNTGPTSSNTTNSPPSSTPQGPSVTGRSRFRQRHNSYSTRSSAPASTHPRNER